MDDNKHIDDILRDIEGQKVSEEIEFSGDLPSDAALDVARKKREEQIKGFSLDFDVDSVIAEPTDVPMEETTEEDAEEPVADEPIAFVEPAKPPKKPKKKNKLVRRALYVLFVVTVAVVIALGAIMYFFEASGLGGDEVLVDVEITQGAYTAQIADMLKEKGIIDTPLFFRAYAKFAKADGKWQVGTFILSADMGYADIVKELQTATPRESVNVTVPEGYTVDKIAELMENKGVCTAADFYNAVMNGEYDYDFVKAIPTAAQGEQYAGRIYRLEGYLFPDTYNFYLGSSGEMVVNKMLANFNSKITKEIRQQISEKGWNIDEMIIFASVIQGEAGKPDDMMAVSKVLTNRMQPNSGFPKLQCDSTRDYIKKILPSTSGDSAADTSAYDTYIREGLPVGAINNPGMLAIEAALNPSTDEKYAKCYYFATDYKTGITYYSKTLAQHEAICRKYKIGMYG